MSKYTLTYFNEIDIDNPDDYYDVTVQFNNRIEIDLNFDESPLAAQLDTIKGFLNNLSKLDADALNAIKEDYTSGDDTVSEYIDHHFEVLEEEELADLIKGTENDTEAKNQLVSKLHLLRVGFYPENEDAFIVLDYSIGKDITDYLIAVSFTEDGHVDSLSMES